MSRRIRQQLIETARGMNASGLNQGMSGNVSARYDDGMLITPSGMDYAALSPADIVYVDAAGESQGERKPSSEWRFHLDIYREREEAGAVVHAHAAWCTTLASLQRPIPAFHYMVALAGGNDIRCARYASFGTQELSDHVLAALHGRKACLMANHGMVCFGRNLDQALALAIEIEHLARVYCQALTLGDPVLLSDEEMAFMQEKFRAYGAHAQADG
jgi:L-fuculose-phosphate aldolase